MKYGFISGGRWYSKTLNMLSVGDRIWVNIPHTGYVGVGEVIKEVQLAKDVRFIVNGKERGFADLDVKGSYLHSPEDPDIRKNNRIIDIAKPPCTMIAQRRFCYMKQKTESLYTLNGEITEHG